MNKQEMYDFMNSIKQKTPYEMVGHSFVPLKHVGKQYCYRCGLVALNRIGCK